MFSSNVWKALASRSSERKGGAGSFSKSQPVPKPIQLGNLSRNGSNGRMHIHQELVDCSIDICTDNGNLY